MDEKTPPVDQPATRTEGEDETLEMPEGFGSFTPGQVLGERYQILEMLGRGGMGEVWHAFDLKLRVEVALKALREDLFRSERRLELLRQEVRAAREVVSPNVCRIFDLIEVEDRELVSMEYVDGATLLGVLQDRGPLELKEAQDIASQFLAGLEAIHMVGLIHRDIKPENIMLTRAGRVVVMDFGLARQDTEGGGTVSGTPAYMAPEQAAGQTLDARADVYAAGVVLAEMVSPDGIKSYESRQSLWEGVRSEPAKLPDSPWAPAIKKAVAKDRERRYHTAHTLTRALEDVTLRVEGAEDLHPYPGLASFTEDDAEYFFGREAEVEQMWRKLEGPPRMLAIMGPSGAGKSSFIAAGLVAHAPPGWGIIRSTPGNAAISSLAGVVARETAGDPDAVELLPRFDDPDIAVEVLAHWSGRHTRSLLIVDQFEELFTQNTVADQQRFAALLGRIVLESNVYVLLSMRDDFAAACNIHEPLRPIFHELTVLDRPVGANLRRAMTQPAQKCGYRFEDDELVDEMLAEVEGERGALPLLAFAAARLWEKRSRETGLLTRQAYHDIGGVGGALARHAEATIGRIGSEHIATVRELFRNLVTAEGTRAVREWNELLSIFSDSQSESPEEVLRQLIDARLLTSYEIRNEDEAPTRRVEIIHESLLANWPRLVRWQTQDADAVQLRDQLRQAARTWEEHERAADLLWSGSTYREFALWRERYQGGLTEPEEAFARAMSAHAKRRKRRRRIAAAAVLLVAVVVATVFGALWRRSVTETRRAEATKLIALGQARVDNYPTAAVAFARASLELTDTMDARLLALEALWRGPPARILSFAENEQAAGYYRHAISPDGRWLAATSTTGKAILFPDDSSIRKIFQHPPMSGPRNVAFGPASSTLLMDFGELFVRSVPNGEVLRRMYLGPRDPMLVRAGKLFIIRHLDSAPDPNQADVLSMPIVEGEPKVINRVRHERKDHVDIDPAGRWLAEVRYGKAYLRPLGDDSKASEIAVGPLDETVSEVHFSPTGNLLVLNTDSGEVVVWPVPGELGPPQRVTGIERPTVFSDPRIDAAGSLVASGSAAAKAAYLWDLRGPPEFEPVTLRRADIENVYDWRFDPQGRWLTVLHAESVSFWPLSWPKVRVLENAFEEQTGWIVLSADGRWLASCSESENIRLRPLVSGIGTTREYDDYCWAVAFHPSRNELAMSGSRGSVFLLDVEKDTTIELVEEPIGMSGGVRFDPLGRFLAVGTAYALTPEKSLLRIVNLETGEIQVVDQLSGLEVDTTGWDATTLGIWRTRFTSDGVLFSGGVGGIRRWDPGSLEGEFLLRAKVATFDVTEDGAVLFSISGESSGETSGSAISQPEFRLFDLVNETSRTITTHGSSVNTLSFDTSGDIIATGDSEGVVRIGPATGSEPHLLLGHYERIISLAITHDGKWVYSTGGGEIRLWPMPDLSKPPLHTLPREELIAKLKTLTNLRVVRDEESSTGWKVEIGPFPGWAEVPEW